MAADHYETLGVGRDADGDEIKRAYRKLARQYHPDVAGDDPEAEARFKEVAVAYEVLSDPERRRRYDLYGPEGPAGAGAAGGFDFGIGDIFDAFFGGDAFGGGGRGPAGPARGQDAEVELHLTLEEAVFGATKTVELRMPVECERCEGSGCEPGTHPSTCRTCNGEGQIRQVRRTLLGQMVSARPCPECHGIGSTIASPCRDCRGDGRVGGVRRRDITVPAGIDDGQRLCSRRNGPAAPRGGVAGDLYLRVRIAAHELFQREGADLTTRLEIPMTQATLGADVTLETLDGPEELTIPPGTQPGKLFRIKGRGASELHGRGRGDLIVQVDVMVPEKLSREEAELLRRFAELRGETVGTADGGLFSKIKSAFQ
jgi:molecular chaperone DnaJ